MTIGNDVIERHDAAGTRAISEELAALFVEVFDTPERAGDPFFGREKFLERLWAYTERQGYELAAVRRNGELAGYMSGYDLPPNTGWWSTVTPPLADEFTTETGDRTFAINELAVREKFRRSGLGSQLVDELLGARAEERATFCTEPHNQLLQQLARRSGWSYVGDQQPFANGPILQTYVKELGRPR